MRMRNLTGIFMSLLVLAIVGCGGGGGGSNTPSGTNLSGTASKGPIAGGTVKVFEIISSATLAPRANIPRYATTALAQDITDADGGYSITIPSSFTAGSLLIQITGGSYKDEATGLPKTLDSQYPDGMRAVFSNISGVVKRGGALSASVTPFTEMAAADAGPNPSDQGIKDSNQKIARAFNLPDILATKALDPTKPFPAGTSAAEQSYALALASLSQYQKDFGGTLAEIGATMLAAVNPQTGQLPADIATNIDASSNNFAGSANNPNPVLNTPAANPSAPAAIQTVPSTTASDIGGSVTVTVQVTKGDTTPVPDGTIVNFTTNLGTLSAASATTVNGSASVTLSSPATGSAVVTATSGGVSTLATAVNFTDPNAPTSLILTANAVRGVTTGPAVVLSANVVRLAGGPVPNGTPVTFAIVSGPGTLTGATATSGGIATVNLTSSAAASVIVRATAGGVSQELSVPFIVQPTQAIVKVRTSGTLSAGTLIGGISATVNYASGKGLSILPANVVASGFGLANALLERNTNTAGQVVLGLISTSGVQLGEYATLTFAVAAGNFPEASDFSIGASSVIDTSTGNLPGVSTTVLSVTIQ